MSLCYFVTTCRAQALADNGEIGPFPKILIPCFKVLFHIFKREPAALSYNIKFMN